MTNTAYMDFYSITKPAVVGKKAYQTKILHSQNESARQNSLPPPSSISKNKACSILISRWITSSLAPLIALRLLYSPTSSKAATSSHLRLLRSSTSNASRIFQLIIRLPLLGGSHLQIFSHLTCRLGASNHHTLHAGAHTIILIIDAPLAQLNSTPTEREASIVFYLGKALC